ncbi:hypothetical protein DLJ53_18045 [Acuticoccus sediminis]|uniref:Uncharacterized protein n=1 Tax=Acuticoccus sediminis TaxID=2184697 RepID=A0A8B2NZ83_9HYPH|nr:hypothetical protein [Acuticoccus sediminis]RAI01118.1 hypothetical protein DLJ53_18045 [Acuticoccus sediminis]
MTAYDPNLHQLVFHGAGLPRKFGRHGLANALKASVATDGSDLEFSSVSSGRVGIDLNLAAKAKLTLGGRAAQSAPTRAAAEALDVPSEVVEMTLQGFAVPNDGGRASVERVDSEPAHAWGLQTLDGGWWDFAGDTVPLKAFSALGDAVRLTDGAIDAGSVTFNSASANWSALNVGDLIAISGAGDGGAVLSSEIVSINSPQSVEIADPATSAVVDADAYYGNDDTDAVNAADAYSAQTGKTIIMRRGTFLTRLVNFNQLDGTFLSLDGSQIVDGTNQKLGTSIVNLRSAITVGSGSTGYFNGTVPKGLRRRNYNVSNDATATPVPDFQFAEEASLDVDHVYYKSGYQESYDTDGGRSGFTTYRTKVTQAGRGDCAVYAPDLLVIGDPDIRANATHVQSMAAGDVYGGTVRAGAGNVVIKLGEQHIKDQGNAVRGYAYRYIFERNNDDESNGKVWEGVTLVSRGSKPVNVGFNLQGLGSGFKVGYSSAASNVEYSVGLAEGQKIEFDTGVAPVNGLNLIPNTFGGRTLHYDGESMRFDTPGGNFLAIGDDETQADLLSANATRHVARTRAQLPATAGDGDMYRVSDGPGGRPCFVVWQDGGWKPIAIGGINEPANWYDPVPEKTVFSSFAEFKARVDDGWSPADGHIAEIGDLQWKASSGVSTISLVPGWLPNGTPHPLHWNDTNASAISAAMSYAASHGKGPARFRGDVTLGQLYWYNLPNGDIWAEDHGQLLGSGGIGGPNYFKVIETAPTENWSNFYGQIFDYEKVLPFRRALRIKGADTLGNKPNPGPDYIGYYGGFATSLTHDAVLNESGYNGDPGEPARTNYSMHRPCLYQEGAGDTVVYRPFVRVGDGSGTAATAVDKPSGAVYGGTIVANSDFVQISYGEFHTQDGGHDVRGAGPNFVFERENDDEENECSWYGMRMFSAGSKAVNVGLYFAGLWKSGIDFSNSTLTLGNALSMKQDQWIDFNATHSRWPGRNIYRDTVPSGWRMGYNPATSAIELEADGVAVMRAKGDSVVFRTGADDGQVVKIQGAASTDELTFGRTGNSAIIRAAAAAGDAQLTFQTTSGGATSAAALLLGNGRFNLPRDTAEYQIKGNKVLGPRITGWAAATGTAARSGFDTATVTLEVLAQHVKSLIDDGLTHGYFGPTPSP